MLDETILKEFLQKKYDSPEAFLQNIIFPVFGEKNYYSSGNYHWLRKHPEDQQAADNAGIIDILAVGGVYVDGSELDIYDVTVASKRQLAHNRVGIQQLIRRIISTHSGAFIIFHYKTSDLWDWRFTFCYKGASMDDGTDAKRYTFLLGPGQSCRTAALNFCKLGQDISSNGFITMDDVIHAFDVEALSDEFFREYKAQYEKFVSYMADDSNGMRDRFIDTAFDHEGLTDEQIRRREEKPLRDYVKKLLGRIVFLYFVQKKGWLGVEPGKNWGEGDMEFMLHLFQKSSEEQKADFLETVLKPLFEDGFNTNRSETGDLFDTGIKALPNKGILRIPYLNGGLFERDASDKLKTSFRAECFYSLLTFFSQYNFTIDENDPNDAQVGIDPEMLGRIFENLLEDNRAEGIYYTPKEIVQYMCKESIIAYLQTDRNEPDNKLIRDFVTSYDISPLPTALRLEIDQKLKDVKVCDPAIGSGAFPMGILKEIFYCRGAIENFEEAARIKMEIINNNLYGVDIEKGAVDIARLRFWLAIIVDEADPSALPNLDYKIMQGNSLLESYRSVDLSHLMEFEFYEDGTRQGTIDDDVVEDTREELSVLLGEYFDCSDHTKKREIEKEIKDVIKIQLSARHISLDLDEIDNIASNNVFFLWHTWFSDVFSSTSVNRKGFNIVIGNPPYIRERDNRKVFEVLRGSELAKKYHTGKMDYWYYFLHKGMDIAAEGAIICFITSRYWIRSTGAKKLIKAIKESLTFSQILDIGTLRVFDNVVGHHMVSLFTKSLRGTPCKYFKVADSITNISHNEYVENRLINQVELFSDDFEINLEPSVQESTAITLNDICNVCQGVIEASDKISRKMISKNPDATHYVGEGIFVLSEQEFKTKPFTEAERALFVKYLGDGDIVKYRINPIHTRYLIYSDEEVRERIEHEASFQNIKNHLNRMSNYITSSYKPYGLHRPREKSVFLKNKIIAPSMFLHPMFAFDDRQFFCGMSYNVVSLKESEDGNETLFFLLGLLNSEFAEKWFYANAKHRGVGVDVGVSKLREFPIPRTALKQSIIKQVEEILELAANNQSYSDQEIQLNELVNKAYHQS